MKYVTRFAALMLFALALSFQCFGDNNFSTYHEGLEVGTVTKGASVSGGYMALPGLKSNLCFYTKPAYPFNTWETGTRFARQGTKSIRVQIDGMLTGKAEGCSDETKQRAHMKLGVGVDGINVPGDTTAFTQRGETRWYGWSFYVPSDEGTNSQWWSTSDYYNIFQLMATGHSATPEVFITIGKNGNFRVENYWSTNPVNEDNNLDRTYGTIQRDKWHDVVITTNRGVDNTGVLKVWLDGVLITNRVNTPVGIADKPYAEPVFGFYFGCINSATSPCANGDLGTLRNHDYVVYFDEIRAGDATSSYDDVKPRSTDEPPVCPGDPRCVENPVEVSSNITGVNGGANITQNQFPVNFTAASVGNAAYLSCLFNNNATEEKVVIWNTTTNTTGYFSAGNINQYPSSTAELKCFYESYLTPITPNSAWAAQGVANTDYASSVFGLTSGLTITKSADGTSRLVTKGDGTSLYAAVPVWTPAAGYEVEFDIIFPTTITLGQTQDYILDSNGTGSSLKPGIALDDATNTIVFEPQTGRTLTMDGEAVVSGVTQYPTDGVPRHMKMVGTSGLELRRILRRYTAAYYGKSTVYNLSLKDLSNSSNNSFYALNEDSTTSNIIDTGARAQNGTWYNRGAEDVISLGTGAVNPAFAYKILGSAHAFSGVATDRMAVDFTYSCDSVPNCSNLYFAVVDGSGDRRVTFSGTAGALVADTLNGGFGTNRNTKNWTVDAAAGVYRARIEFKIGAEGYNNHYSLYAGMLDGVVGQYYTLHTVIPHKNYKTLATTANVQLGNTDTVKPVLSGCSISSVLDSDQLESTGYRATVRCTADEVGGTDYVMITTTDTAPNEAAVKAGTGSARSAQAPADTTTIEFEFGGFAYQDLWAWIVRCDKATTPNCSLVGSAVFDDNVCASCAKRIKFANAATRLRTLDGSTYTGVLDYFLLTDRDPRLPGAKQDLVYIDNPTVTDGVVNFTEADTLCGTCSGSINALPLGQYWYSARSADGTVKSVYQISVVAE